MIETKISSEHIYSGKVVELRVDTVKLPDGREAAREVVDHKGAVAVVALTDEDEIILIKQYRYPVEAVLWEIPAGKLENGEAPEICAKRELAEETGLGAKEWQFLNTFYTTPGFSNEMMHLYLARGLYQEAANPDEDEFIEVHPVKIDQAQQMVLNGEINDAKTIIGVLQSKNRG